MTTFLLDPGHGIDTAGKCSPFVPPGVHEWEFNRDIARRLVEMATDYHLKVLSLIPESESVSLAERVQRAKDYYKRDKDCLYVSIHANAIGNGNDWEDTATGATVFVYKNASAKSRALAQFLVDEISEYGAFRNRGVKDCSFYVLKKTPMPAVLTENGFMTHSGDATKLSNGYWRDKIARAHLLAFRKFLEG